ncbi:hypothetical protein ACSBR1_035699 [Camellia fascicularis]
MDRDGYQDLETEIKSWQPEDRNNADNLDLIPKCPRAKWELKDEIKCVVGKLFSRETTEQQLGLPSRVFKHQLVESSPNVEYYSNKEYPQRKHAFRCQIRAALALPVFEPTDHTYVGVLELLFTTRDEFLIFLEEGARFEMFKSMGTPVPGICLWSSNPGDDIYVLEFFLPVNNKVGGNVMTSLMKEILGTMKKKIQSFKLASGEELGEELIVEVIDFQYGEKKIQTLKLSSGEELGEEFSKVTDFHNGEKLNSVQISQTRPEPLQNGVDLMELESSDQQSMDAVNNESNVISAERSNSTCSQGKGTRKKLKRKQNTTGVSISTLKRACRKFGIPRWSPHHINQLNKNGGNSVQISPTTGSLPRLEPLQKEGDMMQLNSSDQQSMDAINITIVVSAEQSNIVVTCSQEK